MPASPKTFRHNSLRLITFTAATLVLAATLCSSMLGCSAYSSGSGKSATTSRETADEMKTPSLREPGKMLSDEEVAAERKAMDFEDHYRKWVSDEEYLREWYNSGEQREQWLAAMDDLIREIQTYSITNVPESDRALYDQLLGRIMDLRDKGM